MIALSLGTLLAIAAVCYVLYPIVVMSERNLSRATVACAKCGNESPEGASFCSMCGEPLTSESV